MYKNSRKANTECSENSMGKFMNKTKDRYVLQCVACAARVEGLLTVFIRLKAPVAKTEDGAPGSEII